MMHGKKGFVSWKVVMLLLMMLFLAGMLIFLNKYEEVADDMAFDKGCNDYIKYSLAAGKAGLKADMNEAPCRKKDITIRGETKFEILKQVYDQQVECYNTFERGEIDLFELGKDEYASGVRLCGICHSMNFSKNDVEIDGWEYIKFKELKATNEKTYMDILSSKEFMTKYLSNEAYKQELENNLEKEIAIDTSKEYLTIFIYDKNKEPKLWKYVNDVVVDPFFGDSDAAYRSGMFLVEYNSSKLKKVECDYVLGLKEPGIT